MQLKGWIGDSPFLLMKHISLYKNVRSRSFGFKPALLLCIQRCLVLLLMGITFRGFSQGPSSGSRAEMETLLENYFSEDEEKDMEQLITELELIQEHPMNINSVQKQELSRLRFLDPVQINSLLEYREKYGKILSVYELTSVPGFDENLARLTGMFVVFDQVKPASGGRFADHEVLARNVRLLEKQDGYKEPKAYEGSPDMLYLRYRYTSSSVNAGLTAEKDAGESFFRASNPGGFDFYSGYAQFRSPTNKWQAVVGDYVVQFGQGLVAWQGFSLGKSAEATTIGNTNQGIKPYSSSGEYSFMRGAGAVYHSGRFYLTSFASLKQCDANIAETEGQKSFSSFQTTGYHRTAGEIDDENSVRVFSGGGNLRYEADKLSLGMTGIYMRDQYPLVRDEDYNRFLFDGKEFTAMSLDYRYGLSRFYCFGELATCRNRGVAFLNGIIYHPYDQLELSSVFRSYGKRYSSPFASAFSEGSQINDERGFYLGARIHPMPKMSISTSVDFFRFNSIKYTTASAGSGMEFLVRTDYSLNRNWQVYGRYFYECKPVKASGRYTKKNIDQIRQSLRFNLTGDVSDAFRVKTRFEQTFYRHDHYSTGFMICQDLNYHPEKQPLNIWFRLTYFKTGDYDSRIYSYENDLLYLFVVPPLYGEGIRSYLTGKVKICEKVEFWCKLSRTRFFGVDRISSGNSLITGNKRTEVKFQIRFRI